MNNQLFIIIVHTLGGSVYISLKLSNIYRNIPMAYFNAMELRAISQVETDDIFYLDL